MKLEDIIIQILEAHLTDGVITKQDFTSITAEIMVLHEQALQSESEDQQEVSEDLSE